MFVACRTYSCIQIRRKICVFANVIYIVYLRMTRDIGSKARFMNLHRSSLFYSGSLSEEKDKKKRRKRKTAKGTSMIYGGIKILGNIVFRIILLNDIFKCRSRCFSSSFSFFRSFRRRSAVAAKRGQFPKSPRMR